MLTRQLAGAVAASHVSVNAIAPGLFDTDMTAFSLGDPGERARVIREIPLGRLGHPDDAAGLALFLASPAAAYLTGTVIPLDGGLSACGPCPSPGQAAMPERAARAGR
jgi:NAD(P)-dependent dehydrogenase (short-subunit alcohol dehydrogenase family)